MNHATDTALKEESFLSICDLLIMFAHVGEGGPKQTAHLAPLLYKADQTMGEFLNYFIQASKPSYLFIKVCNGEKNHTRKEGKCPCLR